MKIWLFCCLSVFGCSSSDTVDTIKQDTIKIIPAPSEPKPEQINPDIKWI